MPLIITQELPNTSDAVALINELEEHLNSFGYPPQSRHGFSVEKLIKEAVPFFVMRIEGTPIGCGGVKIVEVDYGEVKRMFVRPGHQGQGYGKAMLHHLAGYAQGLGIPLLRLETGIYQLPAIRLYESFGFRRCGPFSEYQPDPVSVYMEMPLPSSSK